MSGRLFIWYDICSTTVRAAAKAVQHHSIPGLYSGIFAMYLQYQKDTSQARAKNSLFYTLCALYILSLVTISLDTVAFVIQLPGVVGDNSYFLL